MIMHGCVYCRWYEVNRLRSQGRVERNCLHPAKAGVRGGKLRIDHDQVQRDDCPHFEDKTAGAA